MNKQEHVQHPKHSYYLLTKRATTVYILKFIQLSNSHSITEYWNFRFTKLSKLK